MVAFRTGTGNIHPVLPESKEGLKKEERQKEATLMGLGQRRHIGDK